MKPHTYLLPSLMALSAILGSAQSTSAQVESIGNSKGKFEFVPVRLERERSHFRQLLLTNANYFGNFEKSELKAVKVIQSNRRYEELMCIGLVV